MKKSDIIENKLHQLFDDYEPQVPLNAWQRLEPNLPPERKKKRLVIFWLISMIVAILAVMSVFWGADKQYYPKMAKNTTAIVKRAQAVSTTFTSEQSKHKATVHLPMSANNDTAKPLIEARTNVVSSTRQPIVSKIEATTTIHPIVANQISVSPTVDVHSLSLLPFDLFQTKTPVTKALRIKLPRRNWRWWIGLEAAPIVQFAKPVEVTAQKSFAEMPESHEIGIKYGISIAVQPRPAWRFQIGLQQQHTVQNTKHQASLRLVDGYCVNPGYSGAKEYEFSYNVISAESASQVMLRLSQQHPYSTMTDDEIFTLNMQTKNEITTLVVPISVQRNFGNRRIQPFVRAGAQLTLFSKTNVRLEHFTEACQDLCFTNDIVPSIEVVSQNKLSTQLQFGAGIEFVAAPNLRFSLEPNWIGNFAQHQLALKAGLLMGF